MKKKAIIISIKGLKLTNKEKLLLFKEKPWGLILFERNIATLNQVKKLIKSIRQATRDNKFPILIDEEGYSVSRLKKIISHNFSANFFGNLYRKDTKISIQIYKNYLTKLCNILKNVGVNINTIPVLDVLRTHTSKVIGDRGFSNDQKIVRKLGEITVEHCNTHKIATVTKHIPGHGSAISDSHIATPRVNLDESKLKNIDFYPFKNNPAQFAMTAHILYTKIDKKNVATLSKKIIYNIIRKKIGFKGILISDDISMKALKYDLVTNAIKSLEAGCNLVLYCAGNIDDNFKLIKSVPFIDKFTLKKTSEFYNFLG